MQPDVLQLQAIDLPEGLVGIAYPYILQLHVSHFTEELRPVNAATAHHQVVGVPDGRP